MSRLGLLEILLAWLIPLSAGAQDVCREGAARFQQGDLQQAELLLKECLRQRPDHYPAYLQLCGLYQRQGRGEDLNAVAEEGLQRFPEDIRFYLTVGIHAGRTEEYDRAISVLSDALARWPDSGPVRENLLQAYVARGLLRLDRQDNAGAADDLEQALALDETNTEALLNLGRALHNLHRSADALEAFDRALEQNPEIPLIHFHRGMVLQSLGEYDLAIQALDREIQGNPGYPPSYYFRGLCHQFKADWEKAAADLEEAVRRMPEHELARYELGRTLVRLGRSSEAEAAFRRSLELNPNGTKALNSLGRLLMRRGEAEEARRLFDRAARIRAEERSADPGEIRFEAPRSRTP